MAIDDPDSQVRPEQGGAVAGPPTPGGRRLLEAVAPYSVLIVVGLVFVLFSVLRTEEFLNWSNFELILTTSAPLVVIALGLTVVLVMNDFDLSFGFVAGLAAAIAISLMSDGNVPWALAIVCTIAGVALVGLTNGLLVAYAGTSSFIITLAVGTAASGVEFLITNQEAIYSGIPVAYTDIGQSSFLGINLQIVIAAVIVPIVYMLLARSEAGRRMYAIGGNIEAARLVGLPVARLRLVGFVIAAVLAGVSGILISASNGAYTPSLGSGLLLPAFAGAFLGSTLFHGGRFTVIGTTIGVIVLGMIDNGLILLQIDTAWSNIVQGAILVGAILAARIGTR